MAVVIVVVVCGLVAMVASCFVWKRRKNHLRDKTLSVAAPSLGCSAPEAIVVQQPTPVTHSPCSLDYSVFRLVFRLPFRKQISNQQWRTTIDDDLHSHK